MSENKEISEGKIKDTVSQPNEDTKCIKELDNSLIRWNNPTLELFEEKLMTWEQYIALMEPPVQVVIPVVTESDDRIFTIFSEEAEELLMRVSVQRTTIDHDSDDDDHGLFLDEIPDLKKDDDNEIPDLEEDDDDEIPDLEEDEPKYDRFYDLRNLTKEEKDQTIFFNRKEVETIFAETIHSSRSYCSYPPLKIISYEDFRKQWFAWCFPESKILNTHKENIVNKVFLLSIKRECNLSFDQISNFVNAFAFKGSHGFFGHWHALNLFELIVTKDEYIDRCFPISCEVEKKRTFDIASISYEIECRYADFAKIAKKCQTEMSPRELFMTLWIPTIHWQEVRILFIAHFKEQDTDTCPFSKLPYELIVYIAKCASVLYQDFHPQIMSDLSKYAWNGYKYI
jgi:hypothetical protein